MIPNADLINELARFWQTHDVTDFEDELEETADSIFERADPTIVAIHLEQHEVEDIKRIARAKSLNIQTGSCFVGRISGATSLICRIICIETSHRKYTPCRTGDAILTRTSSTKSHRARADAVEFSNRL